MLIRDLRQLALEFDIKAIPSYRQTTKKRQKIHFQPILSYICLAEEPTEALQTGGRGETAAATGSGSMSGKLTQAPINTRDF